MKLRQELLDKVLVGLENNHGRFYIIRIMAFVLHDDIKIYIFA